MNYVFPDQYSMTVDFIGEFESLLDELKNKNPEKYMKFRKKSIKKLKKLLLDERNIRNKRISE